MKKVQWIEIHQIADVVRANVQEETQLGVTGSDISVPLSTLPIAVAVKMRAAVDALTAHLNAKGAPVDPAAAAAALSRYTGVPLAPRIEAMDAARAEAQAALDVAVRVSSNLSSEVAS